MSNNVTANDFIKFIATNFVQLFQLFSLEKYANGFSLEQYFGWKSSEQVKLPFWLMIPLARTFNTSQVNKFGKVQFEANFTWNVYISQLFEIDWKPPRFNRSHSHSTNAYFNSIQVQYSFGATRDHAKSKHTPFMLPFSFHWPVLRSHTERNAINSIELRLVISKSCD